MENKSHLYCEESVFVWGTYMLQLISNREQVCSIVIYQEVIIDSGHVRRETNQRIPRILIKLILVQPTQEVSLILPD